MWRAPLVVSQLFIIALSLGGAGEILQKMQMPGPEIHHKDIEVEGSQFSR